MVLFISLLQWYTYYIYSLTHTVPNLFLFNLFLSIYDAAYTYPQVNLCIYEKKMSYIGKTRM